MAQESRSNLATATHARSQAPAAILAKHPNAVGARLTGEHELLGILHRSTVAMVAREKSPDLSARQLGTLLIIAQEPAPHTVRGIAAKLQVSKPAITRALDRLGDLEMVKRRTDPQDRRSVLLSMLPKGQSHIDLWVAALANAQQAGRG